MEILLRLLILVLTALFAGRTDSVSGPPPQDDDQPTFESFMVIENVTPTLLESAPPQVRLNVTGYQPDGCVYPVEVRQSRVENMIRIEIFRVMPLAAMCSMQIVPYQAEIMVEARFDAPGAYTIIVNEYMLDITL
ncbi:MAG: hypothetical protein SF162_11760 [bacterium]|nr:hypothetical protein [bacterium]